MAKKKAKSAPRRAPSGGRRVGKVSRGARKVGRALLSPAGAMAAAGVAAGALGYVEGQGTEIPTIAGIPPALLVGAGLAFIGPMVIKGKGAAACVAGGAGLVGAGAYQYGRELAEQKQSESSEDTGEDEIVGDDEIVGEDEIVG